MCHSLKNLDLQVKESGPANAVHVHDVFLSGLVVCCYLMHQALLEAALLLQMVNVGSTVCRRRFSRKKAAARAKRMAGQGFDAFGAGRDKFKDSLPVRAPAVMDYSRCCKFCYGPL